MSGFRKTALGAVLWLAAAAPSVFAQATAPSAAPSDGGPKVEAVEIVNNQLLQTDTLLFYIQTRPGDRYDVAKLREDFRRLWDTGFLDDLQIEAVDGPQGGKIVRFKVQERKRIQIVDFRGSKQLTSTNIEDELKKRDATIRVDTFYDPAKARRVESIIKEMLVLKGQPFAKVHHEAKAMGAAGQQLSFVIDDGPKTKIKEIVFDGNKVFSGRRLRWRMSKMKQAGFFNLSWLGGKSTYAESKWLGDDEDPRGDRGRIEDLYLNHGYVTVRVGNPKISYFDGKSGFIKKKPVKWMRLEIPITEGEQYRMGKLDFEGLKVLKESYVRGFFKLKEGAVYNESKFKKAYEKLRDLYGSLGYFQWTGGTQRKPDPERKVVDVTVRMEEDKQYLLGTLSFTGNDSTRDKVIRREVYLNEGEVFNTEALKLSIKRINQLGYFKPMEKPPDIRPTPGADNKVDVTFKIEEQNRNQFTFGGGVSGLEGTFLNASFSTTNFLGAGETFQAYVQTGKRTKNYSLSLSEPYFLDRPITAGIDVHKRKITYNNYANVSGYTMDSTGLSLVGGMAVGRWARAYLNYTYEIIKITEAQIDPNDPYYQIYSAYGLTGYTYGPSYDPLLFGQNGTRRESRLTPNLVYNTVDNPYSPRAGMRQTLSFQLTGGPLGGTISYYRPSLESVFYLPVGKRMSLGLRGQVAWIKPFGTAQDVLPYYNRYFLGGETEVRGYPIRSIGPLDSQGHAIGGNKELLFNAEYYFDVYGPLRMLLFFDAGQAYFEEHPFRLNELRTSYGAEVRFIMPVLNVPFRLIYAINPNRTDYEKQFVPSSTFKFAVGTTF